MNKAQKDLKRQVLRRIPPLPKDALQRLALDRHEEEGTGYRLSAPEAEFRIVHRRKDEEGRTYVEYGEWRRGR